MVTLIYSIDCDNGYDCLMVLYKYMDRGTLNNGIFPEAQVLTSDPSSTCSPSLPFYIALTNIGSSIFCYLYVWSVVNLFIYSILYNNYDVHRKI